MRGWLLVGLILLPLAGAFEPGEEAESILLRTSLEAEVKVSTEDAIFWTDTAPLSDQANPTGAACAGDATWDDDGDSFVIAEGAEDRACAWVAINLTIPAGATTGELSFLSNRSVQFPETDLVEAVHVIQRFTLRSDGNGTLPTEDYIAAGVTNQAASQFLYSFNVDPSMSNLTLEWHMQDEGTGESDRLAPAALGANVSISVADIQVVWHGLTGPDFDAAYVVETEQLDETRHLVAFQQTVDIPARDMPASSWNLVAAHSATKSLVSFSGPEFALEGAEIATQTKQGETVATIALGPNPASGQYHFRFESLEQVPPPPVVTSSIAPLYELTVGLIAFLAVGAAYSSVRYWQVATGTFRGPALRFLAAVGLAILYFGFQVVYTAGRIGVDDMNLQDRPPQADTFYVQFGLVGLVLAMMWYVAARVETRRMQADIRERRLREEELERSNAELEQFAYVASHDLQEPLRKVASYTQLLQRRYKDELDEEAHEFIGYAVSGAKRMQSLITDILGFSRVGQNELNMEDVDLQALVADIKGDLQLRLEETKGRVVASNLPTIRTDATLMRQLLHNLVTNGIKFHRPNTRPVVRVSAEEIEGGWRISVADNGIGIAKEHHERVFAVFKRLHRHEQYPGTGIGLALCSKIADLLGGRIRLNSTPGKGSTFMVELPEAAA